MNAPMLYLASASPRRRELLREAGIPFSLLPAEADESYSPSLSPREAVQVLALRKAEAAQNAAGEQDAPILGADTLVELDGRPLGKPHTPAEACEMLRALSGRTHYVHTGAALVWGKRKAVAVDSTAVIFRVLTEEEIAAYVATGEPLDKAGAYGIQGGGGRFVERIEGAFDTVVGLSVARVKDLLRTLCGEDTP